MEDWFRFGIGTVVAGLTALGGWFGHVLFHYNDKMGKLEAKVAVLENRQQVDPVDYTKAITEMSAAIAALTTTIALLRTEIQQLESVIKELKRKEERAR